MFWAYSWQLLVFSACISDNPPLLRKRTGRQKSLNFPEPHEKEKNLFHVELFLLWCPVTLKSKAKPNQIKTPFLHFAIGQYFVLAC